MTDQSQLNWNRTNLDNIQTAWEGDLWDRKRLGIQLTNYVDRLNCGAVLALDARWGEGKTWFVRHWAKHLSDTKHNVIYLDAFANDYLDDPFLVIASEIAAKLDRTADKRLVYQFKKAAAVMQQGLLTLAPTLIASMISCAITGGIIPFIKIDSEQIKDKIDDVIDKVTDNIGEKVTEAIQNKIDSYEEEKNSLLAFKNTLSELAESLEKPLVFIIDELDRCRPDFAIRLIERIKHFFDIPKIVFVLVMDKQQFAKVICHNYGYDENLSEEYLSKFIDFSIYLKEAKEVKNFEYILQSHLLRIDELSSFEDKSEFFYWALFLQLEKKYNARELIKKINQYALLRTDDKGKNIILFTLLMKDINTLQFRSFIEKTASNLINSVRVDKYQFARKYSISTWSGSLDDISDSNWYKIIMEKEYAVKDSVIDQILYAYIQADGTSDVSTKEYYLKGIFEKLAIFPFTHSSNFVVDWENYIKTSV